MMSAEVITDVDIIKVGTSRLVSQQPDGGEALEQAAFNAIACEVDGLNNPIIVTSAGITAGMIATGTTVRPDKKTQMPELQRLATVGWRHILNGWDAALPDKITGGLQLTRGELSSEHGSERQEALQTIHAMLTHGDVPIINENDAIAHEEIAFGDNDQLAACLAVNIAHSSLFAGRVRLFLLTSVNGVYADLKNPDTRIAVIDSSLDLGNIARDSDSPNGTGGMITKFAAARLCYKAGVDMWIYNPEQGTHQDAVATDIGTYFPAPR